MFLEEFFNTMQSSVQDQAHSLRTVVSFRKWKNNRKAINTQYFRLVELKKGPKKISLGSFLFLTLEVMVRVCVCFLTFSHSTGINYTEAENQSALIIVVSARLTHFQAFFSSLGCYTRASFLQLSHTECIKFCRRALR